MMQYNKFLLNKYNSPIIIALDCFDMHQALKIVAQLSPNQCRLKIGAEMFTKYGPKFIIDLQQLGFEIFLDLKFHDIPSIVAKAVHTAANLGVWMVNVHAFGGEKMMLAARQALNKFGHHAPLIVAVTILTSMNEYDLNNLGIDINLTDYVMKLAYQAKQCGLDGVVCSAHEAKQLKTEHGNNFIIVTPSIRYSNIYLDDQSRVMTPVEAWRLGSDYLVMGRSITTRSNVSAEINKVLQSLN